MSRAGHPWRWVLVGVLAVVAFGVTALWVADAQPQIVRATRTAGWKLDYTVFPVKDGARLTEIHRDASMRPREQCVACHGDMTGSSLVLHRIHLRSALLPNLSCHECHRRIDLTRRGNHAVVTWVDVGFCKSCHSPFPGLEPGSKMKPSYFERDCTTCHRGPRAPKHDRPYLARNIPADKCKGCHGGRVLPTNLGHERSDWLTTHGDQALKFGTDSCFQCHDFGIKFCGDCHRKKPPSHLPPERWRTIHAEAARTDTRVCYSCHRTSFCKRCHLNHEEGWLKRHPAFVHENGKESCWECHSKSACGFCHTAMILGSVETSAVR